MRQRAGPAELSTQDGAATRLASDGLAASVRPIADSAGGRLDQLRAALLDSDGLDSIPEPTPLIDGILDLGSFVWLTGKPGSAKSFVAIDMSCCISTGLHWHGHAVKRGPVLYVAAEGARGLRKRVRAWEYHNGMRCDVVFLPLRVDLIADRYPLGLLARELGAVLVVIDTVARVTVGLKENDSADMGRIVQAAEVITELSDACVMYVHHEPRGGENPRGHSSAEGAAETLLRVAKVGPGKRFESTNTKQKDGEESPPLMLDLIKCLSSAVLMAGLSSAVSPAVSPAPVPADPILAALSDSSGLSAGLTGPDLMVQSGLVRSTFYDRLKCLLSVGAVAKLGKGKTALYVAVRQGDQLALDGLSPAQSGQSDALAVSPSPGPTITRDGGAGLDGP